MEQELPGSPMLLKFVKSTAVYGAVVIATVMGAEIIARAYDWAPRASDAATGDGLGRWRYEHSPTGYGDLVPNQDGHWIVWFHRPYHVQTNSVGLRNTEEPSEAAFRILAIGDSQTFGPYLANEDTWPAWAESYLRQRSGLVGGVQVFNAGIAGYSILDELAYLRDKGLRFKPKLVLLALTERNLLFMRTDVRAQLRRPQAAAPSRLQTTLKAIGRGSALVSVFDEVNGRIRLAMAGVNVRREGDTIAAAASPEPDHAAMVARYKAVFGDIVSLVKAEGGKLAALFIPWPRVVDASEESKQEPIIRALARDTATPYLDLTPAFRAQADATSRLYLLQREAANGRLVGNAHLSREGNAVIGRAVADWLIGQELIAIGGT